MVTGVNNSTPSSTLSTSSAKTSTGSSSSDTSASSRSSGTGPGAAIMSALGAGQVDIQSLAGKLVEAERAPLQYLIDNQMKALENKITSIGRIYSMASLMKDSLTAFGKDPRSAAYVPQTTDATKATFTFKSVPSDFNMTFSVKQLATENKVTLNGFSMADSWPSSGILSITQGKRDDSSATPLEFNYGDYSNIEGLRDAINKKGPYKAEIMTAIVSGTSVKYMTLSRGTGADRNFFISTFDDNGDALTSGLYANTPTATTDPGQAKGVDAIISSGGQDYTYFKNSFVDLLPGATINVSQTTKPGETVTLSTVVDGNKFTSIIRQMVSSYNDLQSTISSEIKYDADVTQRGGLSSDPVSRGFLRQMRRITTETITTYNGNSVSLSSLGVRTNADGTLQIDETSLAKAQLDPGLMEAVLASTNSGSSTIKGSFEKMNDFADLLMGRNNALVKQFNQANTTDKKKIQTKQEQLDTRMDALKQRYLSQFIAMQNYLDSTKSAQNSLTQSMSAWTASMKA